MDIRQEDTKEVRHTSLYAHDNKKTGAVTVKLPAVSPDLQSDKHIAVTAEDNAGNQKTWYIELNSSLTLPATHQ